MKKYILQLVILVSFPLLIDAQTDISAEADDITITNSNAAWGWVGQSTSRLNASSDNCYVIPFKLPIIPVGNEILHASFQFNVETYSNQPTATNIDLYGLDFREASTVDLVNDYYAGANDITNATKLQEDILIGSPSEVGINTTDVSGSSNLLTYIKAQYTNGAVAGDYVFLRLNVDFLGTVETWNLTSQNGSTIGNRPILTLTFGTLDAPSFDSPISDQTVDEGTSTQINFSVTDPNGDALSVSYTNLPSFATPSFTDNGDGTGDGTITLAPLSGDAGNYNNITVTVDDGNGNSSDEVFNITVVNPYLFTLTASANDGYVSDPLVVVDGSSVLVPGSDPEVYVTVENPHTSNHMKVGRSDVAGYPNITSAIIPFQLPAIPAGKTEVVGAQLRIYVPFVREYVNSDIDLYGLTFKSSDAISSSDYYSGSFTSGSAAGNGSDYGIESSILVKQNVTGFKDVSRLVLSTNQADLANYINAQYTAGAVAGDWVFLRLSVNSSMIGSQYYAIDGGDGTSVNVNGTVGARTDIKPAELLLDFGKSVRSDIATNWDGTSWTNEEPNEKVSAIIDSYLEVGEGKDISNLFAKNINVTSSGELHVFNGANVLTIDNLTIDAGGKVVIENGGSFNTRSSSFSATINGDFEVIRESRATKNNFTYWSSPLSTTVQSALINSGSPVVYKYNTSAFDDANDDGYDDNRDSWVQVSSDVMTPGVGYAAKGSDDGITASKQNVTFKAGDGTGTKTINSSDVVVPIVLSGDASGDADDDFDDWNLLGNPYPIAISAKAFLNGNSEITKTLYFWTHSTDETNAGYAHSDYAYYNLSGGLSTGDGNSGISPTGLVASGQGFMVDASSAGNVTFTPDMQTFSVNTDDNNNFYKKSTNIDINVNIVEDRLWLILSNGSISNQILIGFFDDASEGYDNGYDAPNLDAGNDINFYSLLSNKPYSIQGLGSFNNEQIVNIGFRVDEGSSTSLNFSIGKVEGNLINKDIILIDNITGESHNLQNSSYSFTTDKFGDITDRFQVIFVNNTLDNNKVELDNSISIFPNPIIDNFEINGLNKKVKSIKVLSLNGKELIELSIKKLDISKLPSGVYILKLECDSEILTKKIIKI